MIWIGLMYAVGVAGVLVAMASSVELAAIFTLAIVAVALFAWVTK